MTPNTMKAMLHPVGFGYSVPCHLSCTSWIKDECWVSGSVPVDSLWKQEENLARPLFILRFQAFIQVSKAHNLLPNLRKSTEQILEKTYEKMG
ncbi:hypothetical protein P618_200022 [Holospora obtusa F1]|uniref:Uncharacterized protein n=1 Tax=Holospora obtusa F1 TaxID=1399147 RepID=W6TFI4_HOLOB|nr:hypothetical protein [Holospora obtusa]ETZ07781.1 hypothetical protein P618_200022 [Holospora obtusa F1]